MRDTVAAIVAFAKLRDAIFDHIEQEAPSTKAEVRLSVARGLAREGVVLYPGQWARLVRDLTDLYVARERRNPSSTFWEAPHA